MTSRPPRHGDQAPPTPKVTGSLAIADGIREECERYARTLDAAADDMTLTPGGGRPDLPMRDLARRLRQVERRVYAWHHGDVTVSQDQRGRDHHDAMVWLAEAQDMLRARGETVVETG